MEIQCGQVSAGIARTPAPTVAPDGSQQSEMNHTHSANRNPSEAKMSG